MFTSKIFWIIQAIATLAFHVVGLSAGLTSEDGFRNRLSRIWLAMLGLHAGEILIARRALKGQSVSFRRLAIKTLLFGFTWWLPRRRGIFQS